MSDPRPLLERVAALLPTIAEQAAVLDRDGGFPDDALQALREAGALLAPLPARHGGLGLGTEPAGATALGELLRLLGRGSLALGRVFEGHVNALRLVALYGTEEQVARAGADAASGHLFGLWNTEAPPGLRLEDGRLWGRKLFCSGAGHVTRALVTARDRAAVRMVLLPLALGERVLRGVVPSLVGMRAAGTAAMDLDGLPVAAGDVVGADGDYLRQPEFSAGAWRTSAVTLGGLEALLDAARGELVARGRNGAPHQLARMGMTLVAQETAFLWVRRAGEAAEEGVLPEGDVAGVVNLARIAVERACLDAMELVVRSLGLSASLPGPVERIGRDLAAYLRQPAPDETLCEAAGWFMTRAVPR